MTTRAFDPHDLAGGAALALVAAGHRHGWAVARELASDGPVGRVWSLSRPLTYRAIDGLVDGGLLRRSAVERGRGPDRSILALTARGRRALGVFLDTPAVHLRDLRTELLLKLTLGERLGRSTEVLVTEQRRVLDPILEGLSRDRASDPVSLWRRQQARAARQFLWSLPPRPVR